MLGPSLNYMLETHVIDTGIGINKENHHQLFKPFRMMKKNQSLDYRNETSNIGLGLASSYDIVYAMGGSLHLEESKAGLTIFKIRVPCKIPRKQRFLQQNLNADNEQLLNQISNDIQNKIKTWRTS